MNIVKWIGALIGLTLVVIAIATSEGHAEDEWVEKPVLCNDSHDAVREKFYYVEELVPMMGGTSRVRIDTPDNEDDVVIFIMFNYEEMSAAIMEYHADYVCAIAFMHNIEFDTDKLKEYLHYDKDL